MTIYSSSKFPLEIGENGWLKTCDSRYFAPTLDRDHICDWLVIGSGFAGISAAKRLTELRNGDKIILIDAIGIGEGAAGQNSGFMIDVPHNINAKGDYLSSIKKDKDSEKEVDFQYIEPQRTESLVSEILANQTLIGLQAIRSSGPIICSGPFANNKKFLKTIEKNWAYPVIVEDDHLGICKGIANLVTKRERS